MLKHRDDVSDANSNRSSGTAFADKDNDDRGWQTSHFPEVLSNRPSLAALFSGESWMRPGSVDKGKNRNLKFGCKPHAAHCFAVSFRVHHPEITLKAAGCVEPFLLSDHHEFLTANLGKPTDDSAIIAEKPVAIKLRKIFADIADIVQCFGPLGMATDGDSVPGRKLCIDLIFKLLKFRFQFGDLLIGPKRVPLFFSFSSRIIFSYSKICFS